MKTLAKILALALAGAPLAAGVVCAGAAVAAPAAYSTATTELGVLLDNPQTKAVLVKYIPTLISNPQIDEGRSMTLKQAQSYAPDQLSDATLAKIDADLAKIPAHK